MNSEWESKSLHCDRLGLIIDYLSCIYIEMAQCLYCGIDEIDRTHELCLHRDGDELGKANVRCVGNGLLQMLYFI